MPGTTLPRGNVLYTKLFATSITPTQVGANTTSAQSFTIQGVAVGDYINCSSSAAQTTGILTGNCRVTAANTVEIQFVNVTGGGLTPVAGTYGFVWGRSENNPLPSDAT